MIVRYVLLLLVSVNISSYAIQVNPNPNKLSHIKEEKKELEKPIEDRRNSPLHTRT